MAVIPFRKTLKHSIIDTMNAANDAKNFLHSMEKLNPQMQRKKTHELAEKAAFFERNFAEMFVSFSHFKRGTEAFMNSRRDNGIGFDRLLEIRTLNSNIFSSISQTHLIFEKAVKIEKIVQYGKFDVLAGDFGQMAIKLAYCLRDVERIQKLIIADREFLAKECKKSKKQYCCTTAIENSNELLKRVA